MGGMPGTGPGLPPLWGQLQPRLLALGLPLLCMVSLHKGALHLGSDIRVGLGVLDAHVLVAEGETLHGAGGVGGAVTLSQQKPGPHLQAL